MQFDNATNLDRKSGVRGTTKTGRSPTIVFVNGDGGRRPFRVSSSLQPDDSCPIFRDEIARALVGLRPSFSSHVRQRERGAPVRLRDQRMDTSGDCSAPICLAQRTWVPSSMLATRAKGSPTTLK